MDVDYNYGLVILSLLLAIAASYAGLSIASRIPHVERRVIWLWIVGGAISLGLAIWSMHFVGMLAFHIDIPLAYDIPLTGLSMLYAIAATTIAMFVVGSGFRNIYTLSLATFFMGSGIAAMHYTGMDALKILPAIIYKPYLFNLSLMIAYFASFIAMRLFFSQVDVASRSFQLYDPKRLLAAIVMGFAIAGMHYTAMAAAIFPADAICAAVEHGLDSGIMSLLTVLGVILIILTTLLVLLLDTKYTDNKQLQESEKRFRQVLNSAPQGMMVIDQQGNIEQVNRSMLKLSGYRYRELMGQPVEKLVPDNSRQQHIEMRSDFFDRAESRVNLTGPDIFAQRKDGSCFPVEITLTPMYIDATRYILATVTDISDRQVLERELAYRQRELLEANQRIVIATDSAEIGIWEYNLIDRTLFWDDWMYRIHDLPQTAQSITYHDWKKTLHPEDVEFIQNEIQLASRGDKVLDIQYRIIKQDDQIAWIKANGTLLNNNAGQPERMIGITQDITHKILNEELIWRQANFDPLTLLPNRKLFHELLEQEIKEAHREQDNLWVLFLDLDGFKEINDTLGHHAGDELLVKVAQRIQHCVREADVVARLGGDEFVVIISHCDDLSQVDKVASKLIQTIAESYALEPGVVHISTSIGIANYPNDASNANDLLMFADQSMYVSKQSGKNRISYFTPEFQESALKRLQISAMLHQAIAQSQFELYYQPIIDLQTGNIHKAEALIRWNHPEKGQINPDGFIPIAEESEIILDLGEWIFEQAFRQLQSWLPKLHPSFQLSINMSPNQIKVASSRYADWTEKLVQYDLKGEHIVIEITEGLLLKSDQIVNQKLTHYRDHGVQIAIDDFGTGYSSLAYLKDFNIDYLKIDRSFTSSLKPGSSEHALSETIVVMAHKLGLKVIAEGIETPQQLAMLQQMHCDYGQGYLISRPLPASEFEQIYIDT